ncbi:MAG: hypothetical protein AABX10_02800 [Nanoarchaeota archaeon]
MGEKIKKLYKIKHLINWYNGNFCVKHKHCTKEHYEELKCITSSWNIQEMTHKEFIFRIIRELKCFPIKREFHDCFICKNLGIPQRF